VSICGFKEGRWAPNFELLVNVQDAKSGGFSGFGFIVMNLKQQGCMKCKQ
jgi:hypothetical protein